MAGHNLGAQGLKQAPGLITRAKQKLRPYQGSSGPQEVNCELGAGLSLWRARMGRGRVRRLTSCGPFASAGWWRTLDALPAMAGACS
jgi:hypothetical protein